MSSGGRTGCKAVSLCANHSLAHLHTPLTEELRGSTVNVMAECTRCVDTSCEYEHNGDLVLHALIIEYFRICSSTLRGYAARAHLTTHTLVPGVRPKRIARCQTSTERKHPVQIQTNKIDISLDHRSACMLLTLGSSLFPPIL